MTRKFLMTSTVIASLIAAPVAYAESLAEQGDGVNPEITEGGQGTTVGSTANADTDQNIKTGIGESEFDPTRMAMTEAQYDAVVASVGAEFQTRSGETLGMVEDVMFDGQGNPELSIKLADASKLDAEMLKLTLLPESIMVVDNKIVLDITADDLFLNAQDGGERDADNSAVAIVM